MEAMVASGWASSARACLICSGVTAGGLTRAPYDGLAAHDDVLPFSEPGRPGLSGHLRGQAL
jgi:hypothetical protein